MNIKAAALLTALALVAASDAQAEIDINRYDALGRLTLACQVSGYTQLTSYYLDAADNRQTYKEDAKGMLLPVWAGITSPDGRFYFVFQSDGNLVLYMNFGTAAQTTLWNSATSGSGATTAVMQGDGNLALYKPGFVGVWSSNTPGNLCSSLAVQNDGNVVIYNMDGSPIWATNTGGH